MLISMTGFGSASAEDHGIACAVEVRSVNNRFYKAVIKLPDKLAAMEMEIDRVLREALVRGSIVLTVAVKDRNPTSSVTINDAVLKTYLEKIQTLLGSGGTGAVQLDVANLMALPGVVEPGDDSIEYLHTHEQLVMRLIKEAVGKLNDMRKREGAALWTDLQKHVEIIRTSLAKIAEHAPQVVKTYHERLRARVNQLVSDAKLSLSDHDLLKEVALFADRADISEEIARLGGHVDQFISVCQKSDGNAGAGDGRKLDFIAQEMLREANTIASKANDTTIARLTVDIKSAIDRIKEQVQNAE
jgi:uncharacterized protein (TIGR00255 family)